MSLKFKNLSAPLVITFRRVLFITRERFIALGTGTFWTFVYLGIGISEPDGNVSDFFLSKSDSLDT